MLKAMGTESASWSRLRIFAATHTIGTRDNWLMIVKFLNKLRHLVGPGTNRCFSNERKFCHYELHNTQNIMWLACNSCVTSDNKKTKLPQNVWIWMRETSCCNTSLYGAIELIQKTLWSCWTVINSWLERVATERPYIWQQDSGPVVFLESIRSNCQNFYNFIRPNFWFSYSFCISIVY